MAVTLHHVAELAGVSIKTVSNVVNDYPHVKPATRSKVLAAIEVLGYQPNLSARSLRSGKTGVIGLALPELSLSYFAELAGSVIEAAERQGMVVLIEQTGGERLREIEVLSSPRLAMTDGLIFSPLNLQASDKHLLDVAFPLVLLGENVLDGPTDLVTMQNVEGARLATEHLLSLGRRRIALIGVADTGSSNLRVEGYRAALAEAGVPFHPELLCPTSVWHRANGAMAITELLDRGVEFDGVFGLNDTLALGAMHVLEVRGFAVPGDVAVIGFDDLDETRYSLPALSTIDPGRTSIADTAVALLRERIDSGMPGVARREVHAPVSLVVRDSTLPVASRG